MELLDEAGVDFDSDLNFKILSTEYFEALVSLLDETSSRTIGEFIQCKDNGIMLLIHLLMQNICFSELHTLELPQQYDKNYYERIEAIVLCMG